MEVKLVSGGDFRKRVWSTMTKMGYGDSIGLGGALNIHMRIDYLMRIRQKGVEYKILSDKSMSHTHRFSTIKYIRQKDNIHLKDHKYIDIGNVSHSVYTRDMLRVNTYTRE